MADPTPTVIGLDVGTSAVKAVVFGTGGHRGEVVTRPVVTTSGAGGAVIQDPVALRRTVLDALRVVIASAERPPDAIAVSTAMHALVGLGTDGEPVTPLCTWADGRAASVVTDWIANGEATFVHDRTGVPLHPMAPVAKLAWFTRTEPELSALVARWADLKALVVGWLTGEVATDVSSASGWGLADIRSGGWDADALELAGVTAERLVPVVSPTATRPLDRAAAEAIGFAVGLPVVVGAADGPCGNVGVGATRPGVAGLSLGTSGAVRVVVDTVPSPVPDGLFCYALTETRRVLGGAVSNGGNVVDWLADTLFDLPAADTDPDRSGGVPDRIAAVLDLAAGAPPGSDGLVMVPYLIGERAPLWDPTIPGAYLGLRRHHSRAHLARAALEGVCAALGVITDRIAAVAPVDEIRATGGTFASPLWRDLVAAAVGRPTTIVDADAGSARGAAVFGLVALGAADTLEAARAVLVGEREVETAPVGFGDELRHAAVATRASIGSLGRQLGVAGSAFVGSVGDR